jgi:hypothetical protein
VEGIRPDEEPVLKTGGGASRLGVRVPRLPLFGIDTTTKPALVVEWPWKLVIESSALKMCVPGVIGSMTGSNPVGQGSNPWGRALKMDRKREPSTLYRAHRPIGRHQFRTLERPIRPSANRCPVQLRVGPLIKRSRGPTATTLGSHPGNDGSIPSGTTEIQPRYANRQSDPA